MITNSKKTAAYNSYDLPIDPPALKEMTYDLPIDPPAAMITDSKRTATIADL